MRNIFFRIFFTLFILTLFILNSCNNSFADDFLNEELTIDVNSTINSTISDSNNSLKPSSINSRSCIIYDRNSKMVLYGKNENSKVKMASTTKIMTAIVVLENCNLTDIVEVSKKAASVGGSVLGIKSGEKITVNDLLHGLLICSGNDTAIALAEYVGGDVNGFLVMMNNKAKELGLTNTNFETPHGLDSDNHYTTAYELAVLTDYALKNDTFTKIVSTKNYTVTIGNRSKTINNTNALLGNLNGVYGVKTGFTNGANRCLVSSCKRGEMDIICVVLGADTSTLRLKDSIKLIEYAFANFDYVDANKIANDSLEEWKNINMSNFNIIKSSTSDFEFNIENIDLSTISINKNNIDDLDCVININNNLEAPLNSKSVIGSVYIKLNDTVLKTLNIVNSHYIERKNVFYYFNYLFSNYNSFLESILTKPIYY